MSTATPEPQHGTETAAPAAPERKKGRLKKGRLKILLLLAGVPLLSATAFTGWLLASESGLRFALYQLPKLGGVHISSKNLNGTVLSGFSGEQWQIRTESADLALESLTFKWQPGELWQRHLHINTLSLGNLHITTKPTPPKAAGSPPRLPDSISLPFAVTADKLAIGRISSGSTDNVLLQQASFAYRYDHQSHSLQLLDLQSPWSSNQGNISIQTATPYALSGQIDGSGRLADTDVAGTLELSGSLQQTSLNARLAGGDILLSAQAQVSPFGGSLDKIIGLLQVQGRHINPADFLPAAPKAELDFDLDISPARRTGLALDGTLKLDNRTPLPADAQGIPLRSLNGRFSVGDGGLVTLEPTVAELLQQGRITLSGSSDTARQTLNLNARLSTLTLSDVAAQPFDEQIDGNITLQGSYREPQIGWTLAGRHADSEGRLNIQEDTAKGQRTLRLEQAVLTPRQGGSMKLDGSIELFGSQALQLTADSRAFNPAKLHPALPEGSINGKILLAGQAADARYEGKMDFGASTLSGVPLKGSADLRYEQQHLSRALSDITLGNNRVRSEGSFGKAGDKLNLDINAPELGRFGFGLSGNLQAKGYLAGEPAKIEADLNGSARNLSIPGALNIASLDFKIQGSPDYSRPLNLTLNGQGLVLPAASDPTRIDTVRLAVQGTGQRHGIQGQAALNAGGKPYTLNLAANGGLDAKQQWKGTIGTLDIAGAFNLKLQNSLQLEAGTARVSLGAARWSAMGGSLNLDHFVWDKQTGLSSKGSANSLHMAELHNFYTPPVKHDLVLAADWDLSYSQNARGYLNVRRQSGDITMDYRGQTLGLDALSLSTRFQNGRIDNEISGNTRYGKLSGTVAVSQQFGSDLSQAPVSGRLQIDVPDLGSLKGLMPVGQSVKGRLNARAELSGRVGSPQLNGTLDGDNLYYINRDLGLILDNGSLRSKLNGQKWQIDSLKFVRGGNVSLSGDVSLDKGNPDVNVRILFDKYQALDKPNRRLSLSGDARLHYVEQAGVTLDGTLTVDDGHFGFQKSAMPTLGDDVTVVGDKPKEKTESTKINMNLVLDLNDRFRFSGEGLDVTLGGRLNLTAKPGSDVQGVGTVKIVKGKYKAYAQDLNINKGSISFVGPLDNPNLNIRATRNLSPVGAGVEVLGNLENPRITLVADETMSEKDKLSWLILNRASSGSDGDEAALAAAAGAFLAGKLNDKLGLVDNFGFSSQRTRNAQTGEMNPAEQVLTVGKQLTNELYLGYEYGITSASQSVKAIYQITRSVQAIGRVGSEAWGGELKYVFRFD